MRATAKVPLTGITRLLSSSVGGVQIKQFNREKLSVVARSRGDRTFPAEVAIAGVAEGNQPLPSGEVGEGKQPLPNRGVGEDNQASPSGEVATAPLVEVSEEVKRGNRAAVVVRAVKACPQEGAVAPEVVVGPVVVAEEAVEAAAVVVAAGDDKNCVKIINIVNHKFDGGESDAY